MDFIFSNLKTILLSAGALVVLILLVKNYQRIKKFLSEVKAELGKVAWSTRQELLASTVVVIVVTVILGFFIGIIDLILSKLLTLLFK